MPRQCWPYSQGVPVMPVTFEPPAGGPLITKTLEVDCGASGGITAFIFDQATCQQLGLARGLMIVSGAVKRT